MTDTTQLEQRSPEWFQARKGRITGSIAGACLGMAPYMTPEQAMRSMVRSYHNAPSEFEGNIATEYGTKNEPEAIWCYTLETGNDVTPVGFYAKDDWLGASPDGKVSETKGLEVKCPFGLRNDHDPQFKTLDEQPHYKLQVHLEMYCAGWVECDFYQWTPNGSRLETVSLDMGYLGPLLLELREFYDRYLIEITTPDEHLEPLRKEYNTNRAKLIVEEIEQLSEAQNNAKERQKELMDQLVDISGGENSLIWGRKLTKVERSGSISYAKVVKDIAPDVDIEKYRGRSSSFWKLT